MKNIFGGGAQTNINGLKFEQDTDLLEALASIGVQWQKSPDIPRHKLKNKNVPYDIFLSNVNIGKVFQKKGLYIFLENNNIQASTIISKQLEPDDVFYFEKAKKVFIIEKKFQSTTGSVDEKLQTCEFKKIQYQKLFDSLSLQVEYIYVLSDWFKDPSYKDTLDFIIDKGCHYFFNTIPLSFFEVNDESK